MAVPTGMDLEWSKEPIPVGTDLEWSKEPVPVGTNLEWWGVRRWVEGCRSVVWECGGGWRVVVAWCGSEVVGGGLS